MVVCMIARLSAVHRLSIRARLAMSGLLVAILSTASHPALAQVKAQKKSEAGPLGGNWYGAVELRHHLTTYYDAQGYYARQAPSTHVRGQVGAQFYEGLIDAYATLGVYKEPRTQQVSQRQPELAIDVYPFKGEFFTLQQYNLLQLPYKGTRYDPESEELQSYGTTLTLGLAPAAKLPLSFAGMKWELKGSVDGWTRLYSRRQYVGQYLGPEDGDEDLIRFGLTYVRGEPSPDGQPVEDSALHYRTLFSGGFVVAPAALPTLAGEASANMHTRYDPIYERKDGQVDYEYGVDRYSYYRLRASYALNERISVVNDFYHFFDGAFEARRKGDARRYRNIARITCRL